MSTVHWQTKSKELRVTPRHDQRPRPSLPLLLRALNDHGIRYCHWKSNIRLQDGLNGRTDLDLLVDPAQREPFTQLLTQFAVKPLNPAPGKDYPGIENHLGFDAATGKLFHLHVHYQLVLGEQFVKNHHLPLEETMLNSARLHGDVPVPTPELELIILSVRALLKYRDRDGIKDLFGIRNHGLPPAILKEIGWLQDQTTPARIDAALSAVQPVIPADVVAEFLDCVAIQPRNGRILLNLRARLRRAITPYRQRNPLMNTLAYHRAALRRRHGHKMTLPTNNATLAIIGADGAGKSTMSHLLADWFSWKLDTRLVYLGSKQPGLRSQFIYKLFRISRRTHRTFSAWFSAESLPARTLASLQRTLFYSHDLSIGRDRYHRYLASQNSAQSGTIVIYDRFPLEAPLDGPRIPLAKTGRISPITRYFAKIEQETYRKIGPPEHCIFLDVSLDVAMQRKPDHDQGAIQAKIQYLTNLAALTEQRAEKSTFQRIDADLPFEEVVSQLKSAVWQLF